VTRHNAPVTHAGQDRRRARRTRCEPLRVRLNVYREGTLVDLSQGGALVHLRSEPPAVSAQVTLAIEWHERTLHLPARVVRLAARGGADAGKDPSQREHEVALEFLPPGADAASDLARLVAEQRRRTGGVGDVDSDTVRLRKTDFRRPDSRRPD